MKKRQILIIITGGLVTTVLLLTPLPLDGPTGRALGDAVHGPLFGLLAMGLFWQLRAAIDSPPRRAVCAGCAIVAFSAVLEVGQSYSGRQPSWGDLMANALGALAAVSACLAMESQPARSRRLLALLAVGAIGLSFYRPATVLADRYRQWLAMPVLASFENAAEMRHWRFGHAAAGRTREFSAAGEMGLRLDLNPGNYPGATYYWPAGNWSDYDELALDVYLPPGSPLYFVVKVEDRSHRNAYVDRFNGEKELLPGRQTLRIPFTNILLSPEGGPLDLTRVAMLQLFTVELKAPRTIFVDNIRLEKRLEGTAVAGRQPAPDASLD